MTEVFVERPLASPGSAQKYATKANKQQMCAYMEN